MNRDIIKLATGAPLRFRLNNPGGTECNSRYNGKEWRYDVTQTNGASAWIYLVADASNQLRRSGAQGGDDVEILRTGDKDNYSYRVRVMGDAAEPEPPRRETVRPYSAPPSNTNGPQMVDSRTPSYDTLTRSLVTAIDAAIAGEAHAKGKGMALEFTSEDIRAMGLSIYINKSREQNGRAA